MAFPLVSVPKPERGSHWLHGKQRRAARVSAEQAVMREVKRMDGGCRYPLCEHRAKKPRLDVAHVHHRGMGGNPSGDRTTPNQLIALCFICHGLYDAGRIDLEPVVAEKGTRGPCHWYASNPETGNAEHVATEKAVGISEPRR